MKKFINLSFIYAIAAIACGVFYREFTKAFAFTGRTALAFTHLHLFVLGTVVFLLLALFEKQFEITRRKLFRPFFAVYNIGLIFMVLMMFVRGIAQVLPSSLTSASSAAISGIAGLAHTTLTAGIVLLFLCLKKSVSEEK